MDSKKLDNLIVQFMNGNDLAFDEIYYETKKSVYLSIKLIVNRSEDVEDLMQDTYLKALEKLDTYKLGTNFNAWISKIARNMAINFYNKAKRIVYDEEVVYSEASHESKLDYYLSFLDGLERDIVIYKIILNMSYKEISNIIDKPISTIHDIYKRAIKRIKNEVKDES